MVTNAQPDWLKVMADMETSRDELEPHQIEDAAFEAKPIDIHDGLIDLALHLRDSAYIARALVAAAKLVQLQEQLDGSLMIIRMYEQSAALAKGEVQ